MSDTFSSIWFELGHPKQRKILVCQAYQDCQFLDQLDNSSLTIEAQLARWTEFIDQWERAHREGKEVIVMGDLNLDFLTWTNDNSVNSHSQKMKPLVDLIFDRIFPHGFTQCVKVATCFWSGYEPSGLDHLYTNKPEKLSEVKTIFEGGSDHKLILATRFAKAVIMKPKIIKKTMLQKFQP